MPHAGILALQGGEDVKNYCTTFKIRTIYQSLVLPTVALIFLRIHLRIDHREYVIDRIDCRIDLVLCDCQRWS